LESVPKGNSGWGWWRRRSNGKSAASTADRRKALRLPLRMPVWIYGWLNGEPFSEKTESINVCAVGGLISITAELKHLQKLIVTNLQTNEELKCRVARIEKTKNGEMRAGLEFLGFGGHFWRSGAPVEAKKSSAQ
jgi:hypothetical protein